MADTNPEWDELKLPGSCPECGEEWDLAAEVEHEQDGEVIEVGEIFCYGCGHTWDADDPNA